MRKVANSGIERILETKMKRLRGNPDVCVAKCSRVMAWPRKLGIATLSRKCRAAGSWSDELLFWGHVSQPQSNLVRFGAGYGYKRVLLSVVGFGPLYGKISNFFTYLKTYLTVYSIMNSPVNP